MIPAYALAAALMCTGVVQIFKARAASRRPPQDGASVPSPAASITTRAVIGICALVLGYHIAAWVGPDSWFGLKVPQDRWWILLAVITLSVAGSCFADHLERRESPR